MTHYQIQDETNDTINEFRQREMALCHLDVVTALFPEHSYHIQKSNAQTVNSTPHLIVNFGS